MPTVTITHADGSTDTIPETTSWTRRRLVGGMRRARITVERSLANAITLEPKSDTVALGSIDTLRLVDVETGGSTWTLVCYSFEWDANRVAPTAGGNRRQGDDQTLITNLVSEVPSWSTGTINSFTNELTFILNHAHRHEALRRIERNVPGEIQFRDSGTVDYVQRLGSDRSGSVELSSAAGTIENAINITERGRELDGTHIRVLGAHEGEAQYFANLVPSDDTATYANRVNYTTSRWSAGDARDWDRWENKDIADQATLESEAAALGQELTESLVEATATVSGVDLNVGDTVQVVKSDANLNRPMRVHRIKTITEGATQVDEVLLSTRTILRNDASADLRDIQRFNTAFQGMSVWGTLSGGYQAVTSSNNYLVGAFDYPAVDFEHEVSLWVKSVPYKTFSSGAASGGGDTTADNADYTNVVYAEQAGGSVSLDANFSAIATVSPSVDLSVLTCDFYGLNNQDSSLADVFLLTRLRNQSTGDTFPESDGVERFILQNNEVGQTLEIPENVNGDTISLDARVAGTNATTPYDIWIGADFYAAGQHTHSQPTHTHAADPGVQEFGGTTASNVDVLVNGSTEATNIGSGEFETTVDLSGALTPGQFNNIELTSDSTGGLFATLSVDAYRQIGAN